MANTRSKTKVLEEDTESDEIFEEIINGSIEDRDHQFVEFTKIMHEHMKITRRKTESLLKTQEELMSENLKLQLQINDLKKELHKESSYSEQLSENINILRNLVKIESEKTAKQEEGTNENIQQLRLCIEHDYATIRDIQEMDERLNRKINQLEMNPPMRTNVSSPSKIKFNAPVFGGTKSEQPMKFLRELRNYCRVTDTDNDETKYVISQAMRGIASEWWQIAEEDVQDWKSFEQRFAARFWSESRQSEIREKLQFGRYTNKTDSRQCDYAMRLYSQARELTTSPSENEIIRMLARHFNPDIHAAILSGGNYSKESLFLILERFDDAGFLGRFNEPENHYETVPRNNQSRNERTSWRGESRTPIYNQRPDYRNTRYNINDRRADEHSRERIQEPQIRTTGEQRGELSRSTTLPRHTPHVHAIEEVSTLPQVNADQPGPSEN